VKNNSRVDSDAGTFFEKGVGHKIYVSFCPQTAKHLHQSVISMGVGPFAFSSHLTCMGICGRSPQRLAIWGDLLQNNPFLGMFQLKFCLKKLGNLIIIVSLCTLTYHFSNYFV